MELTVDQALQKGIEAHKAGKVQEADRYYTAILKANPKHPDANHNMGLLAVGVGKVEEALPFFKTALEVNSNITQYWLSYIDALIKLDRMADAKEVFEQAKSTGAKGDGFDQIEKRFGLENIQEPSQDQLQNLLNLHTQGQYQQALNKGSQLLEQFPNSINLYNIIGATYRQLGKQEEAVKAYTKAIEIKSDYAEAYNNMAVVLQEQGKPEEAIEAYTKAISIKPDYADPYYNMGNVLKDQGKLDEAIEACNKALSIKPNFAEAHYNMGNALKDRGKLDEAIEAYNNVLSIKPDYADAYNNMGVALKDQGKLEKAIEAYNKALSIKSDYADAYYNKGNALKDQGKQDKAIEAYITALSIKPDFAAAYNNIGIVLKGIVFTKPNRSIQKTIVSLLDKKTSVRPKDIAKAAISLLKFEPNLLKHLKPVDADLLDSPLDVISDLSKLTLLLKLMSVCPLPDLELEKLLKNLRYSILLNISSLKEVTLELIGVQSALALQCFTNEYIYNNTKEEGKILRSLEVNVRKALEINDQPSPQIILALASYKALNEYDWCNFLVTTDHLKEVITRQVEEPNEEEKLKKQLPILEEITDSVSSKVRNQYEESPYPRWVNVGLPLKLSAISNVIDELRLKIYDYRINEVKKPDILVAGCGTGQHSIGTATRFKSSNVLAVDLSLSSLAYAKRKTNELAVENINYLQADILDLTRLDKQFDIIESGGVLHHMSDPMAGWKVLSDCLKPGGLMSIGLYSERAREHIVKIHQEIKQQNIKTNNTEMRSFRDTIMRSDKDHHKLITKHADFYSLSTLKDLLFHVQEHRFTIPQIKDCLDKLGLKFCGFESNGIIAHFMQAYTEQEDPYSLDKWQAYEHANPKTFTGMYHFWCQKAK